VAEWLTGLRSAHDTKIKNRLSLTQRTGCRYPARIDHPVEAKANLGIFTIGHLDKESFKPALIARSLHGDSHSEHRHIEGRVGRNDLYLDVSISSEV
jgi:hypothetical protein